MQSMKPVLWQDFQHKQLIDLFEKIKEARSNNKDKNLYRYTVAFLAICHVRES